jgi:hypothetical protein
MGVSEILASVDREIALLKQARALLDSTVAPTSKRKVGRPKKTNAAETPAAPKPAKKIAKSKRRNLSPEGRKRIADAVKRRWDAQKKAAATSK